MKKTLIKLNFKKLHEDAILPSCKHESDAGRDIYSVESGVIPAHSTKVFSTGIALQMEWGIDLKKECGSLFILNEYHQRMYKPYFKISSRSGLASNGIHVIGGVVDNLYRGEIRVILANTSNNQFTVTSGDRIAQGIVELIPTISSIDWVESIEDTDRGGDGFGSSGR